MCFFIIYKKRRTGKVVMMDSKQVVSWCESFEKTMLFFILVWWIKNLLLSLHKVFMAIYPKCLCGGVKVGEWFGVQIKRQEIPCAKYFFAHEHLDMFWCFSYIFLCVKIQKMIICNPLGFVLCKIPWIKREKT